MTRTPMAVRLAYSFDDNATTKAFDAHPMPRVTGIIILPVTLNIR